MTNGRIHRNARNILPQFMPLTAWGSEKREAAGESDGEKKRAKGVYVHVFR